MARVSGYHHLTMSTDGAQEDFDFYTKALGLHSVKRTVLFDGVIPVYHLYYGSPNGDASTIITTFPFRKPGVFGRRGTNQSRTIMQSIPKGAADFWVDRLNRLGAGHDDIRMQFTYIRPEEPLAPMQRNRFGQDNVTQRGKDNLAQFEAALEKVDPSLIVADGMTVLYGLHGLDSNDAVSTDVITTWLKKLTRNGRSTVIVIDHAGKGAKKGDLPIGSQHKVSMVQGTLLQAWPITQPMPGKLGEIELVVLKDRPGRVRQHSLDSGGEKAQVASLCRLDSRKGETSTLTFAVPPDPLTGLQNGVVDVSRAQAAEKAERARMWEERVKHVYGGELDLGLAMKEIIDALSQFGEPGAVKAAILRLVDQGWLEKRGNTRAQKYHLVIGDTETMYGEPDENVSKTDDDGNPWKTSDSNTRSTEKSSPWSGYRSDDIDLYSIDL